MIKLKQFYFVLSSVNRNFAAPSYLRLTIKIKTFYFVLFSLNRNFAA